MRRPAVRAFVCAACLLAPAATLAQEAAAPDEPIVVKGQLVAAEDAAWSTTTLTTEDIREQGFADFDDLLRFVPGVAVRDFGLGGVANAIVIRGFGNGGHGGDLGAVIDGIPLNEAMSHADGYVDLNVVVPLEVDGLTVYRGPVSALYGNYNRGGLVRIDTRKGGDYLNFDIGAGAFETADVQAAAGHEWGGGTLNVAGQFYLTDGYRPRSDQARQTLSARAAFDLSGAVTLALSGRYHHADANSASYLTAAQYARDPYGIDVHVTNDGATKHFGTLRADLSVALSPRTSVVSFAYGTGQDFTRWFTRPVSATAWRQREESYDRRIFGAGTSLNGSLDPGWTAAPITYSLGAELFRERTDFQFYDGLDRRRRTGPAGNDRRTELNSASLFAEVQAPLHRLFDLSLGLRGDSFTGGCRRLGPETGSDPCGALNDVRRLSPKLGARSQLTGWLQARASWAEGFALPNNFVKYAVGGQVLDPNVFRQTELGLRLTPLSGLVLDAVSFRLNSTQEVRTVAPGIFENFGRTRRHGIEASGEWQVSPSLWARAVYAHVETRIVNNADAALVGKAVAGVPDDTLNVDAMWRPVNRWSLAANWRHVGRYAVDAANRLFADPYDTIDLRLAHEGTARFAYRAYLRADNVANARYATSVSVIGGRTLMAPGAPRTVRAGMQLSL